MKCTIPEISWHNREPVLSVDIQLACKNENFERLATGGMDSHVVIWHVEIQVTGAVKVEFAADLQRHQRGVNVVKFSPSGEFLASADDESAIIIWKQKTDQDAPDFPSGDSDNTTKEQWLGIRVLRGHMEDVYDLSWSPDSLNLISGSVDNSAIVWDVHKGRNVGLLKEHKGFVQGVAWDPLNQYVATLSSDRMCRVYNVNNKKLVSRVSKAQLPVPESSDLHGKVVCLFHDDTLKSFFRRLCFSPDGQLLIVPAGIIENSASDKNCNATFIFTRHMLNRPAVYLPSNNQYTVAVRCCPLLFELRDRESMFALPYRMILAVATQTSVLLYDTQQPEPFGIVSNIHYTRLTDVTWSGNGRMLVVSSTDGYCSIVTFAVGELGVVYEPRKGTPSKEIVDEKTAGIQPTEGNGDSSGRDIVSKDTARTELSEGTDKPEGFLDKPATHSTESPKQICGSDKTLNNHECDETAAKSVRLYSSEETEVTSHPSEEKFENVKNPDLQTTPESSKINFCGISQSLSQQEKTPRRIKPILLSSPQKVSTKPFHSSDVSERKMESTPVRTPKRICPIMIAAPNKSLDYKSSEAANLGDISDADASERIHLSPSQCSPNEKQTSGCRKRLIESTMCTKPLAASEAALINGISSDSLITDVSVGKKKINDSLETTTNSYTESDSVGKTKINDSLETTTNSYTESDSVGKTKINDSLETTTNSYTESEVGLLDEPMKEEHNSFTPVDNTAVLRCIKAKPADAAVASSQLESMEVDSNDSLLTKSKHASKVESLETSSGATSPVSPLPSSAMPVQDKRTPRRVQLITLSSPKSRKKLL